MAVLPARLPLWAYIAAGGAAFGLARLAAASPGSGPAAPTDGAAVPASGGGGTAGGAGDLWGNWSDQGTQFGGGGSIGFLPGVTIPADTIGDALGGQPIITPPAQSTTNPPPSSTPTPTPSATYTPKAPAGARPKEAVGWVQVSNVAMHQRWGTWSAYPGPVSSLRSTAMTGSRWVSAERLVYLGSDPQKKQFRVRRVANTDGTWSVWFVPAGATVRT